MFIFFRSVSLLHSVKFASCLMICTSLKAICSEYLATIDANRENLI